MTKVLGAPVASDDVTVRADFCELSTLVVADGNLSTQDLVRIIRRSGSTEALSDADDASAGADVGSELSQTAAEDTFSELEDRQVACGGPDACYPFTISDRLLQLNKSGEQSAYLFMLLLTKFGIKAGPKGLHGERLFEDLCRHAAERYFGGEKLGAQAVHFGFPRRVLPKGFRAALHHMCSRVGDMVPNDEAPMQYAQKDAKLDIVAWRDFPDRRPGKLIGFGQCAAGLKGWRDKVSELQAGTFIKTWMRQQPSVDPIRMFFVPWRLPRGDHRGVCIDAGIVFDRCRVAFFCDKLDDNLAADCARWSAFVIDGRLK